VEAVLFFLAAIGALGGAIGVVAMRNPFYSVLALVVHLFSLAVLFLLLTAAFVAAAQVVVYAGAIIVLYVFVAAYVGGAAESAWEPIPGQRFLAPLLGIALFIELAIAVLASSLRALSTEGPDVHAGFGDPAAIGNLLLEKFLIPFEASSILLLLAAVGAVVLASRRGVPYDAPGTTSAAASLGPAGGKGAGGSPERFAQAAPTPAGGEGAGGTSERFAREERDASGDSPTPPHRRVASEEAPPAPSPRGGLAS
jgi:NADH-quinone oxidoreductase subunit J